MGVALAEPGTHSTIPPRRVGGMTVLGGVLFVLSVGWFLIG